MAKAVRNEIPQQPKYTYTLTLSQREAVAILRATDFIGGDPDGPRGAISEIAAALIGAGIKGRHLLPVSPPKYSEPVGIYFDNNWPPGADE